MPSCRCACHTSQSWPQSAQRRFPPAGRLATQTTTHAWIISRVAGAQRCALRRRSPSIGAMRPVGWAVDFLFPPRCPACLTRAAQSDLCATCRRAVRFAGSPLCPLLWRDLRRHGPRSSLPPMRRAPPPLCARPRLHGVSIRPARSNHRRPAPPQVRARCDAGRHAGPLSSSALSAADRPGSRRTGSAPQGTSALAGIQSGIVPGPLTGAARGCATRPDGARPPACDAGSGRAGRSRPAAQYPRRLRRIDSGTSARPASAAGRRRP